MNDIIELYKIKIEITNDLYKNNFLTFEQYSSRMIELESRINGVLALAWDILNKQSKTKKR